MMEAKGFEIENINNEIVLYNHSGDKDQKIRFRQLGADPLPAWAVNVRFETREEVLKEKIAEIDCEIEELQEIGDAEDILELLYNKEQLIKELNKIKPL